MQSSQPVILALTLLLAVAGMCQSAALLAQDQNSAGQWLLTLRDGQVEVSWKTETETQQITGYRFTGLKKPVLFPVIGPGGVPMTRQYPLVAGVAGEATDHPHHKSIWLAHGDVNGHSYWDEKAEIRSVEAPKLLAADSFGSRPGQAAGEGGFVVRQQWMATRDSNEVVADEETRIVLGRVDSELGPLDGGWWVQYQVKVKATAGDLKFGDTKEGFFAIRTHPNLRLTNDPRAGVTTANGRALNATGLRDKQLWGQAAQWVAYGGMIGDQPVTMVMMDHPTNLRHPTTWHAREYGLVAANPFGLHDFQKLPAGAGDFTLSHGQILEFCYRIAFLPSILDEDAIRSAFRAFATSPTGWSN